MSAWIALPLCLLVALAALPLRAGFLKLPGAPLRVGLALGPARRQWTLSAALSDGRPALRLASRGGVRLIPFVGGKKLPKTVSAPLKRAARFLIGRLKAERLDAAIDVGLGDACAGAMLTALLNALLSALAAARPGLPLRRRVACAFSGRGGARLMGIFSVRAGHIMLAALVFGRNYCIGRLRTWTSIPSKTS